jgi:hypothetical protein
MLCDLGVMTGLDVLGFNVLGRPKPQESKLMPDLWKENREYVMHQAAHDAETTCHLYQWAHVKNTLSWRTKAGHQKKWDVPKHESTAGRWYVKTVGQALRHREPRHTWDKPITRASCTDWITVCQTTKK